MQKDYRFKFTVISNILSALIPQAQVKQLVLASQMLHEPALVEEIFLAPLALRLGHWDLTCRRHIVVSLKDLLLIVDEAEVTPHVVFGQQSFVTNAAFDLLRGFGWRGLNIGGHILTDNHHLVVGLAAEQLVMAGKMSDKLTG